MAICERGIPRAARGDANLRLRNAFGILASAVITAAAAAQCGPPDNTCVVTPASGPRIISSWPSSDIELDWVALDTGAAYYAARYPDYGVFDTPVISAIQAGLTDTTPTVQPTCNYMLSATALHAASPSAVLGTYVSGDDVRPTGGLRHYPGDALSASIVPSQSYFAGGEWANWDGSPRLTIDMNVTAARTWFASALAAEILHRTVCLPEQKLSFVYMDNIRHPGSGYMIPNNDECSVEDCSINPRPTNCQCVSIPWSTTTSFLASFRSQINGIRLVVNVAGPIWGWTQNEVSGLISAVDGICHERPFDKHYARVDITNMLLEIGYYQQWLAAGKTVLWAPSQCGNWRHCPACVGCDACPTPGENVHEERVMAALAMLIRQPGQSIFVARDYFRSRPTWALWPQQFGAPQGDYVIASGQAAGTPVVLTRRFQNSRIWANLSASQCNATAANSVQTGFGPAILDQPRAAIACPTRTTAFHVSAIGIGPVRYQWKKNGIAITNARAADLMFNSAGVADAGLYSCTVSDNEGSRDSAAVTLTVGAGRPGDTNGDGRVDNFDINPFVAALVNPALATTCAYDTNGDGSFDNFDINAMVELVLHYGQLP